MSSQTEVLVDAYVTGMQRRGELLPGAGERLKTIALARALGDPAKSLAWLVGYLAGDGKRYLDTEHTPGAPEAPARAILRRLEAAGLLGKGAADRAYEAWAADLAVVADDPAHLAEAVGRAVGLRSNAQYLRDKRPLSPRAERVLAALRHFGPDLRRGLDLEELAQERDWARLGDRPPHEVARAVADRLRTPLHAARLTRDGEPLQVDPTDPVFRPSSGTPEMRAAAPERYPEAAF